MKEEIEKETKVQPSDSSSPSDVLDDEEDKKPRLIGYVAYPFAGEAPPFDPNIKRTAKETEGLAPVLAFNDYATHVGETVLQPKIDEFNQIQKKRKTGIRLQLKRINYLAVIGKGGDELKKDMEARFKKAGMPFPKDQHQKIHTLSRIEKKGVIDNAGTATYLRSRGDDDPTLKGLSFFHQKRKKKEQEKFVELRKRTEFLRYHLTTRVDHLQKLYVDRREKLDALMSDPALYSGSDHNAVIDRINALFATEFNVDLNRFDPRGVAKTKAAEEFAGATTQRAKEKVVERYVQSLKKRVPKTNEEVVLNDQYSSIESLNKFFLENFEITADAEQTQAATIALTAATTIAEKRAILGEHVKSLLEKEPYGDEVEAISRACVRELYEQKFNASAKLSKSLRSFYLSNGAQCVRGDAAAGQQGPFILKQPFGDNNELRIEADGQVFLTTGLGDARHTIAIDAENISEIDRHFQKHILDSIFGPKNSDRNRDFDRIRNTTFESVFADRAKATVRQEKVDDVVEKPFKKAVDAALRGVANYHGTGLFWNAAHYGQQFEVNYRWLFHKLVIKKARRGELFISGPCGFQQEVGQESGGVIIAMQSLTGRTGLTSEHLNDPYTVEVRDTFGSIENHTETAGITEKPVGQFADESSAWALRDVEPLFVEVASPRTRAVNMDGSDYTEEGSEDTYDGPEEKRYVPVLFQGKPVLRSSHKNWTREDDATTNEITYREPVRKPVFNPDGTQVIQPGVDGAPGTPLFENVLRDDLGNEIHDEYGNPVTERTKVVIKKIKQTQIVKQLVKTGTPPNQTEEFQEVAEEIEIPEITHIERWVKVPMPDGKGSFKTKEKGKRMLCTYQKVVQTGGELDPINPEILLDRIYIPLSCVHTQGVYAVGYAPLRPNTKITGHAIHPDDIIYGFTTIPGATLNYPNPHPVHYPLNTFSQTGMAEAIEIFLGNRTVGRFNQYHTDMHMEEGGKKFEITKSNKSRLRRWLLKQSKKYFAGMDPDWAGRFIEPIEKKFEGNREGLVPAMETGVYIKQTRGGLLDASKLSPTGEILETGDKPETGGLLDQMEEEVGSTLDKESGEIHPDYRYSPVLKKDMQPLINDFRNSRSADAKEKFVGELKKRLMFDWVNEINKADRELEHKFSPALKKLADGLEQLGKEAGATLQAINSMVNQVESALVLHFEAVKRGEGTKELMDDIEDHLKLLKDAKNSLTLEAISNVRPGIVRSAVEKDFNVLIRIIDRWVKSPDFLDREIAQRQEYRSDAEEKGHVLHDDTSHDNNARPSVAVKNKYDGAQFQQYFGAERNAETLKNSAEGFLKRAAERQRIDKELAEADLSKLDGETVVERETDPLVCWENMLAAKRDNQDDALRRAANDLVHTKLFSFLSDAERDNHAEAWISLVSSPDFNALNASINRATLHEENIAKLDQQLEKQADSLKKRAVEASTQRRYFRPRGKNGWVPIALGWKASAASDLLLTTTVGAFGGAGAAATTATAAAGFSALLMAMGVEQSVGAVYTEARVHTLKKSWEKYAHKLGREEASLRSASAAIANLEAPSAQQVLTQDIVNGAVGTIEKSRSYVKDRVSVLKHNRDTQILNAVSGSVLTAIGATGFASSIAVITSKVAAAIGAEKLAATAAAVGGIAGISSGAAVAGFGTLNMALATRRWYRRRALRKEYIYNNRPRDYTLTKTFNKIEQMRRKSYRFDMASYGAMTAGGVLLATAPATKGVTAIPGAILVAASVGAAYIAPRREWRGRNVRSGENTSHVNNDFLTSEARKNDCLRTLNAEAGAMDNALSRIIQHKIDGDNEYSAPMDKQFRYKLQSKRWMRWLVNDYDNKIVAEQLARKFDETKDVQFDMMKQITEHEREYLSKVKKAQKGELDAIDERIAFQERIANGEPHDEQGYISMRGLQQEREKAAYDLQKTTEQYNAIDDLYGRLRGFEHHQHTKLDGRKLEAFNKLRFRFLVAHDLLADVMTRQETRDLVQKQQNEGGRYISARIGGKDYPDSQSEVKGKVRGVSFDYSNDKTFDFLMNNVDRLDTRFAEMMCFSFKEKTAYEVNTVVDIWEEELLKASKKNNLRQRSKNKVKRLRNKAAVRINDDSRKVAQFHKPTTPVLPPDNDMSKEFKDAFKANYSQLGLPFTREKRAECYRQYQAVVTTVAVPATGGATSSMPAIPPAPRLPPDAWFKQKIAEKKAKDTKEKTQPAVKETMEKKTKTKRRVGK